MKRLYLILLLAAVTFSGMAQTIGEAFYVYRNDGQFNAFFRDEVDSIAYSHYDADSVYYDENVTQLVYTADSLYRIPLAAIDSVGFVTPETKYRPQVIVIEGDLRSYVLSSDGLTIRFRNDTPTDLQPRVGDKLVTTELSETFLAGFAGMVESVEERDGSILVTCTAVGLEEVFEEFYYVNDGTPATIRVQGESGQRRISQTWEGSYSPGEFFFSLTTPLATQFRPDPKGDLAFEFSPEASVSITPTYRWKTTLIVSPILGTMVSVDLIEEDAVAENLTISGVVDWTHDFTPGAIPVFALAPFVWVCGEIGAFLRAKASVSMEQHWKQTFRYTLHYEAASRTFYTPWVTFNGVRLENEHSGQLMAKGELGVGIYAELGVEFMAKWLLSAGGRAEAGIKVGGDVMLYKKDMETALRSTDLYKTLQGNDVHLSGFWNVGMQGQLLKWGFNHNFEALSDEKKLARFSIVPDFSNVKLERGNSDKSMLYASAKANGACLPQDLGFTLFEQEIPDDGIKRFSRYGYMGTSADLYASYFNMPTNKRYEVYPTIRLFGVDALTMLAEPKAEELGETTCPDSNHPHMIDLGLPSGTKWACCNVGASTPEGYGNYYAWGETQPKSVYDLYTYAYWHDKDGDGYYDFDEIVNIGSDIAGTSYDAATANWGAPWRMPSLTQIQELLNNTTKTWTTQNGVNGRKFTGPNSGTIFLPAAGYLWNGELNGAGSVGYCWASGLFAEAEAYCLYFFSWGWYADESVFRARGLPVRPVR